MSDMVLVEGLNELNVQMVPIAEWVSPTGDNGVLGASKARDGNLGTWAGISTYSGYNMEWTDFMVFSTEPIMCSGIRFNVLGGYSQDKLDIDVQYDGTWHHIFDANPAELMQREWIIVPFPPAKLVTAARVRIWAGHYIASLVYLYEFQFWHGTGFPGQVPGVSLGYASLVRCNPNFTVPPLPGWNPGYSCGSRWDYQAFEVDVMNIGDTAAECVLECYIRSREIVSTALWSDWRPASNFECTLWCSEPWRCCFNAEAYRIKKAVIQPGQIVTFRGLCWIHGFADQYPHGLEIQAKFVGSPGEILSSAIPAELYA